MAAGAVIASAVAPAQGFTVTSPLPLSATLGSKAGKLNFPGFSTVFKPATAISLDSILRNVLITANGTSWGVSSITQSAVTQYRPVAAASISTPGNVSVSGNSHCASGAIQHQDRKRCASRHN